MKIRLLVTLINVVFLIGLIGSASAQPTEEWQAIYDSGWSDRAIDIAVDVSGNVYVTGYSYLDYCNAYNTIKYDSNGNDIWHALYDSYPHDGGKGIAVDVSGNVYVTGTSYVDGSWDFYTIKYDADGNKIWHVTYDGGPDDYAWSIAADTSGNIYVTGTSYVDGSCNFITIKYDAGGNEIWKAIYNCVNTGLAYDNAVDASGNVYVTGTSYVDGSWDFITIKYDADGNEIWKTTYDGGSDDRALGIAVDVSGNVYVTGYSYLDNYQAYNTIKYDSNGIEIWCAIYDGGLHDVASDIAVDVSGNVYVTGRSRINNDYDYYTIKYDSNGNEIWCAIYDGGEFIHDYAEGIAVDVNNNIYITGESAGSNSDYCTIKYSQEEINNPPIITSITANPHTIFPEGSSTITIIANDLDGDMLSYSYVPMDGEISGIGSVVTWTAPPIVGTFRVDATVSDGEKSASDSVYIPVANISILSPSSEYQDDDTYIWVRSDYRPFQPVDFPVQISYDGVNLEFDAMEKTIHLEPEQNSSIVEFRIETSNLNMQQDVIDHFDVYIPYLGLREPVQLKLVNLFDKDVNYLIAKVVSTWLNERLFNYQQPDDEIDNFAEEVLTEYELDMDSDDELKAMALLHYVYTHSKFEERGALSIIADPHDLIHEIESSGYFHGVCRDYTSLYNVLAEAVDLKVRPVSASFENGGGHAWSEVKINEEWILVDSTHGFYRDSILNACSYSDKNPCRPTYSMSLWEDERHNIIGLPNVDFSPGGFWPIDNHKKIYEHYPIFGGVLFAGTNEIDQFNNLKHVEVTSDYSYDSLPPANSLVVGGFSPVDISIYDSNGVLIVNAEDCYLSWTDLEGNVEQNEEPIGKIAVVPNIDLSEEYTVEITGTGEGSADIMTIVETIDRIIYIDNKDISVSSSFKAEFSPTIGNYNLEIDNNGDGITDEIKEPDSIEIIYQGTNNPPIADANGPYESNEGSLIALDGFGSSDPDGNIMNYEWDFDNDGQYDDATGVNPNIVFDDDGSFIVGLKVTDDDGGVGIDTLTVIVNNVVPTITSLTGPVNPSEVNIAVSMTGDFADPGILDTHTATFNWGDGATCDGTVTENEGSGTVSGTHTYTEAGVYTVTLIVEDDDGDVDSEIFQYVVVYDPDGGFVTGGGWINSPIGAYVDDITLTGKAMFGFVSKYKKGQTIPTGNTEFQFITGDLNFHSINYDWLVIAGPKAMYKGTGTINGVGSYGFILSAIDKELTPSTTDVDMFRIKIWDMDNSDIVVYDNQIDADDDADDPTTAIQGGNIVIHK